MKILFLSRLYWPHGGGVEKHVEKLSEQLIGLGHSVVLITEQYDQELPEKEVRAGVTIHRIPYFALRSKLSLWTWIENQIELFDTADVIHVHDVFWWYWPVWLSRPLKSVHITFHGYEGNEPPRLKAIFWRKIAEKVCRGSICIGDFMRKWYWARPTMVSYGAADCSRLPKVSAATAVFLGRFEEDTGVLVYAGAMKRMVAMQKVDFYGMGSQQEALEAMVRPSRRIRVHPWTGNIRAAMRQSRFAFVSRYLGIIEAMQSAKLVVAVYNNQIKRDYLMSHPMRDAMVIAGNQQELVRALTRLLQHPDEEELMVERAYDWALHQKWRSLAAEYLHLWAK